MKKLLPLMIAAAMICALFTISFAANDVDATTDAGLYLNGNLVTEPTGDGWSYNSGTKTLTLEGANFTTAHTESGGYTTSAPLYYGDEDTLKIVLVGNNNSITGIGTGDENCGIYVRGSLEISGTGSLTVNNTSYGVGIMAVNHLTILGGNITSISGPGQFDVHVAATEEENGFLMSGGTLHLSGSGNMDVNGGAGIKITGGLIESEGGILASIGGPGIDGPFEIAGGQVIVHNATADGNIAFGSRNTESTDPLMITHDAPLNNAVQDGNALKAITAGDASIGSAAFTVSFDANGGTGTMANVTGVSGEYTLPESAFTAPDGKEFKCWKVGDDEKDVGDKITVTSDITVKAVWKDKSAGGDNNLGLIIGGIVAGVLVVGAVAFFIIRKH